MTDVHIADRVYIEPVNVEFLEVLLNASVLILCWQLWVVRLD